MKILDEWLKQALSQSPLLLQSIQWTVLFLLAVMNVFLGIRLSGANLYDTPLYIMIVYAVGVAVVIVFSEYLSLKNGDRVAYVAASKDVEGQWVLLSTLGK